MNFTIQNSELEDLDEACRLFRLAIDFQKSNGLPAYRNDARDTQERTIKSGDHYKLLANDEIAAVFILERKDEIIWRHMNDGSSIYMHNIIANPKFKGHQLFSKILQWTIEKAKEKGIEKLRLDTWYPNPSLIKYYSSFGFNEVEIFQTPNTKDVHENFRGNRVVLLEMKLI